jgi:deoxyribodipyrimidine photo-lyase
VNREKRTVWYWMRRDLRLNDNTALSRALKRAAETGARVQPLFIFDPNIIGNLPEDDSRITFIHDTLRTLNEGLFGTLTVRTGDPTHVFRELGRSGALGEVYAAEDYEPYPLRRDREAAAVIADHGGELKLCKDHVIFSPSEILKKDGSPYTVYTPYSRAWLAAFEQGSLSGGTGSPRMEAGLLAEKQRFPELQELGFTRSSISVRPLTLQRLREYGTLRDLPAEDATTCAGPHLRFGTVSIRELASLSRSESAVYLGELVWREFFIQVLYHFPHSAVRNFRPVYDNIRWRDGEEDFGRWCRGETGFAMVDAGMRQLNETGFMHNRVRMAAASFLCKDLLIDWRRGEEYFAAKLNDYEMASNVGNWQWAAGTGCDAVPYFRIFNPESQRQKFDPDLRYVRRWIPELMTKDYPKPMVSHAAARLRALDIYRAAKDAG